MKGQEMLYCNCICSWQPARVVHGDGHIRSLTRPVTVGELLKHHPHHFVCEPTSDGPLYHSGMLPLDMELEEGRIYLLLPLPRLLPHLASTLNPNPPCCPCFAHRMAHSKSSTTTFSESEEHHQVGLIRSWLVRNQSQFLVTANVTMRKFKHKVTKSKLVRSLVRMSKTMLPERLKLRLSFQKLEDNNFPKGSSNSSVVGKSVQYCSRNRWRPGLECISEVDLLTGLLIRDTSTTEVSGYR